jgi:hypothetical protein
MNGWIGGLMDGWIGGWALGYYGLRLSASLRKVGVTHFMCMGSETRNEAENSGENYDFIGEFDAFGESHAQRTLCVGSVDYWIFGLVGTTRCTFFVYRKCNEHGPPLGADTGRNSDD